MTYVSTTAESQKNTRHLYLGIAIVVTLIVVLLIGLLSQESQRYGSAKLLKIMPSIGAEYINKPLNSDELGYPLRTRLQKQPVPVTLNDLPKNKLIFLNLWATWCQPCRQELPSLVELIRQLPQSDFQVVALSYDESFEAIDTFFSDVVGLDPAELGLTIWLDPTPDATHPLRLQLGTDKLPDSYLIYNGQIIARFVNQRQWSHPQIVEFMKLLLQNI